MTSSEELSIWTVYKKPRDYPNNWVARRFEGQRATSDVIVAISLEDLRGCLLAENPYLVCLSRHESDDPVIVETWL